MISFNIEPVSKEFKEELKEKIDNKAKPKKSLGYLEHIALKIGCIQQTTTPYLNYPTIAVFAADHGITEEGVSSFPQEFTHQMVYNYIEGRGAINVISQANGLKVKIVDAGVNHKFKFHPNLINAKIGMGTNNFAQEPAMTREECLMAINKGSDAVTKFFEEGSNVIGFGEMGVGNSTSATALLSMILDIPVEKVVGDGRGLSPNGLQHKIDVIKNAFRFHSINKNDPVAILSTFGGFEIAMICGGMLRAAQLNMIIIVDGFVSSAAAIMAYLFNINVLDYCFFSHMSNEKGHELILDTIRSRPILNLEMSLGEGVGAALAYPLIQSSVALINEMASFEEVQENAFFERED
jgi:nicotinate-nucleotide--dimethylbenzimidazole phosphoribosyltransferase